MGVNTGDPNRLLAGTDVAGNVCGRSNSPITNVSNSGLSMQGKKYLYFDWVRTAKILGQSSLNSVLTNTIGNFSTQFKKEFNIINVFCKVRKVDRWCTPSIVPQFLRNVSNQPTSTNYFNC